MPQLINELVDIYQLPTEVLNFKGVEGVQITIGDLHGNAMKLMYMLLKHGIASNISTEEYNRLVQIYQTPIMGLTKELLEEFNSILAKAELNNEITIRLIGDELADRGNNDYFTLKILEKLQAYSVPVEIIVSNHGIEFIEAYEKKDNFHAPMLIGGHALSMEKLQYLVEREIVTREEILEIAKKAYKPTLKALSYSLSEDNNEITIYSHAGVGLNSIKNLAQKLGIEFKDATSLDLARTIDNINEQFQKHVQNNTVNTLYTREKMYAGYSGGSDLSDAPFEFILWNRLYDNIDRPAVHSGYNINFVHGHDANDATHTNIYNLDNMLGKLDDMNVGLYTVLYSHKHEVAQVKECKKEVVIGRQALGKEVKPTVITLSELQQNFSSQLEKLNLKEQDLRSRGHQLAADAALELHKVLQDKYDSLIAGKIDATTFKSSCTEAIDTARPKLEKHRGWKQVLGNLALAVVGLGVFYAMAGLINMASTGNFLFFRTTDSINKLDKLEQTAELIANNKK